MKVRIGTVPAFCLLLLSIVASLLLVATVSGVKAATNEFTMPADLNVYKLTQHEYYNEYFDFALVPSATWSFGVVYGLSTHTESGTQTKSMFYAMSNTTTRALNVAASGLTLGHKFLPVPFSNFSGALPNLLLSYESKMNNSMSSLYLGWFDLSTNASLGNPQQWINPAIPEPSYYMNGTFAGNTTPGANSSAFVSAAKPYRLSFAADGSAVYVLIRTAGVASSVKLIKYAVGKNNTLTLLWKQVLVPTISGKFARPSQLGRVSLQWELNNTTNSTQDQFVHILQDIVPSEHAALKTYLNVTIASPVRSILYRVDAQTGKFSGIVPVDLKQKNESAHHAVAGLTGLDNDGFLYAVFSSNVTLATVLNRYKFAADGQVTVDGPVDFSIYPQDIVKACSPVKESVYVHHALLDVGPGRSHFLVVGQAQYKESSESDGYAFVAHINNPATLFQANYSTPARAQLFGVSNKGNSGEGLLALPNNKGILVRGIVDRVSQKNNNPSQDAAMFISDPTTVTLFCEDSADAPTWLSCFEDKCTEWCYRLPLDSDHGEQVLGKCLKKSGDDDDVGGLGSGQVIGIGVGAALGGVLVGAVIVGVWFGVRRQRRRRRGYAAVINIAAPAVNQQF